MKEYFFQQLLKTELDLYLRNGTKKPSLRKFAKHLGINSGTLSKVISGQRGLTAENTDKIIKALALSSNKKSLFLKSIVEFRSKHFESAPQQANMLLDEINNQIYQRLDTGVWEAIEVENVHISGLDEKINSLIKQISKKLKSHGDSSKSGPKNPIGIFLHLKD